MRNLFKPTNEVAATRYRLGLTQAQFAVELGISLSMLKMVETNRRSLSSEALVKLAALEIRMAAMPAVDKTTLPPCVKELYDNAHKSYAMQTHIHESHCINTATYKNNQLKKMQRLYSETLTGIQNLETILKIRTDDNDPFRQELLNRRAKLLKKLSACSPQEQAKLKNKIVLLYAEASLNKSIHPRYVHTNEKPFNFNL